MESLIGQDNRFPVYNIKAVSRLSGLPPFTLRAWERRYGLPRPIRGGQGYRLYTEQDVRTLKWLKAQMETGLSISRAVEYLNELRSSGQDPIEQPSSIETKNVHSIVNVHQFSQELYTYLANFNETAASDVLRRAFALYAMDQVLIHIVQPVLVELGEGWHQGKFPIAIEHYASQFFMQTLMSMLASSAPPNRSGIIIAACAPGEMHQIGILILTVMLRWRGWDVKYLGPDLKLDRLEEILLSLRPNMLMFSATRQESAVALLELPEVLSRSGDTKPFIILGGQAFQKMHLPESIPAVYLDSSPTLAVNMIEEFMLST